MVTGSPLSAASIFPRGKVRPELERENQFEFEVWWSQKGKDYQETNE